MNCIGLHNFVVIDISMLYSNYSVLAFTIVFGSNEFEQGLVAVKNMQTGEQESINLGEVVDVVMKRVNGMKA